MAEQVRDRSALPSFVYLFHPPPSTQVSPTFYIFGYNVFVFVFYCNNYLCFFLRNIDRTLPLSVYLFEPSNSFGNRCMLMLLLKFKSPVRRLLFIPVAQDPSSPFVFLRDAISHFQRFFNTSRKILLLFYFCNKRTQRKKEKRLFCTPKKERNLNTKHKMFKYQESSGFKGHVK